MARRLQAGCIETKRRTHSCFDEMGISTHTNYAMSRRGERTELRRYVNQLIASKRKDVLGTIRWECHRSQIEAEGQSWPNASSPIACSCAYTSRLFLHFHFRCFFIRYFVLRHFSLLIFFLRHFVLSTFYFRRFVSTSFFGIIFSTFFRSIFWLSTF